MINNYEIPFTRSQRLPGETVIPEGGVTINLVTGLVEALADKASAMSVAKVEQSLATLATSESLEEFKVELALVLKDKANKLEVTNMLDTLSSYVTTETFSTFLSAAVTSEDLTKYLLNSEFTVYVSEIRKVLDTFATRATVNNSISLINDELALFKEDLSTKTDNTSVMELAEQVGNKVNTIYFDDAIKLLVTAIDFNALAENVAQKASSNALSRLSDLVEEIKQSLDLCVTAEACDRLIGNCVDNNAFDDFVLAINTRISSLVNSEDFNLLAGAVREKAEANDLSLLAESVESNATAMQNLATKLSVENLAKLISEVKEAAFDSSALDSYVTTDELDTALLNMVDSEKLSSVITSYATKTALTAVANGLTDKLSSYSTKSAVSELITSSLSKYVSKELLTTTLNTYCKTSDLSNAINAMQITLDAELGKAHTHTFSDVEGLADKFDAVIKSIPHACTAVHRHEPNLVVRVGVAGDYETINKALNFIYTKLPCFKTDPSYSVSLLLLDGFVLRETVIIADVDISWVTITGENNTHWVDESYITDDLLYDTRVQHKPVDDDSPSVYAAFCGVRCGMPRINVNFRAINGTVGWGEDITVYGYLIISGAHGQIEIDKGFSYFSGPAIAALDGASLQGYRARGKNSLYGIVIHNASANVKDGNFDDNYYCAMVADAGAIVNAEGVSGLRAYIYYGLLAAQCAVVNATGANFRRYSHKSDKKDICVQEGGIINACGSTGGYSQKPNKTYSNGIIFGD